MHKITTPGETQDVDILLVNPSLSWKEDLSKRVSLRIQEDLANQETPHIGMAYILGVAKGNGLKARYIEMITDQLSPEELVRVVLRTKPRLIGFSAFTVQIRAAAELAALIKTARPESMICVGGPHVSALPQETLEEFPAFDFCICGEGERLLPVVIERMVKGESLEGLRGLVVRGKEGKGWDPILDIDALPFPAWEEFNLANYPGAYPHRTKLELPMVTGRGCPFKCVFCCRALGNQVRRRSVASVIAEIEHNIEAFGCESIVFLDETFILKKQWSENFFDTMKRRGLHKKISWSCSTRVNDTSPDLFAKMRETGCYYIFFGMESANDETLKLIKKGITTQDIRHAVRWAKEAGIIPVGAFIIGLPGDTENNTQLAIELGKELDLYSITFPIAVPFPGTVLREMALKGEMGMRILSDNWDHYGKQDPGVMDSLDLEWANRKRLQSLAYSHFPKQRLDDYITRMRTQGHPF